MQLFKDLLTTTVLCTRITHKKPFWGYPKFKIFLLSVSIVLSLGIHSTSLKSFRNIMLAQGTKITQRPAQKCSTLSWYSRIPTSLTLEPWWFSGQNVRSSIRRVASSILARGTKIFVAPGEHGSSFFQVKMFTGSVGVLPTSASLKLQSNYLELGYTSCWQMIKETCWKIIYLLMSKFFQCRLISN